MPPFRWIEVAGLDLDRSILRPPAALADLFETAPRELPERIVEAAVEHEVDGVLISPSPVRSDLPEILSLEATDALQDLVESLRELNVTTVVATSAHLPFWRRILGRDEKTCLLLPGQRFSLHDRNDQHCAELIGIDPSATPLPSHRRQHFTIGMAPTWNIGDIAADSLAGLDYLAVGLGTRKSRRLEACLAHCPGSPLPWHANQTGPHGISLVHVDGADFIQTEFLPTSLVRFETLTVTAPPEADFDELALIMVEELSNHPAEEREQAWVVTWHIQGHETLLRQIENAGGRSALRRLLPEKHQGRIVSHRFLVALTECHPSVDNPFASQLELALQSQGKRFANPSERFDYVGLQAGAKHQQRVRELLANCDQQSVENLARRLGRRLATVVRPDLE